MPKYQVYFDTVEGEKKYDVDIDDHERLEDVLGDVIQELQENGHMLGGVSTGDLKVVWGGKEGRELDLSQTLPEQQVRPNDVLRVLVETYDAGGASLRTERIEREWALLERLRDLNPEMLEVQGRTSSPADDQFRVRLMRSPGVERARDKDIRVRRTHVLRIVFPRFYPDVPTECFAEEPLFHPNIRPETMFICLWEETNPRENIIQAVARAQAMAAYRMVNMSGPHVMNPAAADWYTKYARPHGVVPLGWDELKVYEIRDGRVDWLEPGRSLASRSASRLR